jgi:hypothetical protein
VTDESSVHDDPADADQPDDGQLDPGSIDTGTIDTGQLDPGSIDTGTIDTGQLDPEQADALADAQAAMDAARERLAEVPAEVVVTNHVMGLYELGAIHLSASPPDLRQAALAIDAVACLVDGLGDRIGEDAPTMRDALNNIRLAFVQIKGQLATDAADGTVDTGPEA